MEIDLRERALHVIDVENVLGGTLPMNVGEVFETYRRRVGYRTGDLVVAAASHLVTKRVAFDLPTWITCHAAGGGADAADRWLLRNVDVGWACGRVSRVVIGSGDGIFWKLASDLRSAGVRVEVAAIDGCLSRTLNHLADEVHTLDRPDLALAA